MLRLLAWIFKQNFLPDGWPRAFFCRTKQRAERWIDKMDASDDERKKHLIVPSFTNWMPQLIALSKGKKIPLPRESWSVTSDSLAAWLAQVMGASELSAFKIVQSKSVGSKPTDLESWSKRGYVDQDFCTSGNKNSLGPCDRFGIAKVAALF